jgi:superfamily I DNA/RNA helicase
MDWLLSYLDELPPEESVCFLHPRGGRYLDYARRRLREGGIEFVEMQGRSEWPQGSEQVGLSTLHSAKGLEFDHVVILGLNADLLPLGPEEQGAELEMHRRIVAMAIARARESVVVTFKPEEASRVAAFLDPATFEAIEVT